MLACLYICNDTDTCTPVISNPLPSELILLRAFDTAQCRVSRKLIQVGKRHCRLL
ncbi:hypothetical protein Osc7112_5353 [Oscillatoria nigro-viridis PCC 7112]|uniref:Uncharacterized protein n=1 Tax=Phormidium nigroviride PCC 7112 TaxID=179408 RepID=K9VNU1_9CYAN|nr:hypothetical protein Osc7112_5353 [Oscillatoria nigro-viridis PCC 7112]